MTKIKRIYLCQQCGAQSAQWKGQCTDCQSWNSFAEETVTVSSRLQGYAGQVPQVTLMSQVTIQQEARIASGLEELNRVLGGGVVAGSVVLIGGDPGIGKSTLLLQTLCFLSQQQKALYVTGEESLPQVTLRARRLGLPAEKLLLLAQTQVEQIITVAKQENPQFIVVDSIQTMFTEQISSAPGSISQVRESAAQLVQFAKQTGTALFIVGHVTKEGTLAGPRVLEHMVDTVLYFEGDSGSRFRVVRAVKNRFGAVNEIGIFAMTEKGLKEVSNPSAIFLSGYDSAVSGSAVMVTWEGTRPLLVEIQALVDTSHLGNPRRIAVGVDQNRLSMLLAILNRHGSVATYDQDVFVNAVGGIKILEPAMDLALLIAVLSSLRNRPITRDTVIFGEVGLAGEIRPVPCGIERLRAAVQHGFKKAIIPKGNSPKQSISGLTLLPVAQVSDAISAAFNE